MTYFVLDCVPPRERAHRALELAPDTPFRRWHAGVLFSREDRRDRFHPPTEPIVLTTVEDTEDPPRDYPEYMSHPIPLVTRRLAAALQAAGVDNLQFYPTTLVAPRGPNAPPADHYLAMNVVGLVDAADLGKSVTNPEVTETKLSMDFNSLAIDEAKTGPLLMFRLAQNVSAVLVAGRVREQVEQSGIDTLTWYAPEEWAG